MLDGRYGQVIGGAVVALGLGITGCETADDVGKTDDVSDARQIPPTANADQSELDQEEDFGRGTPI